MISASFGFHELLARNGVERRVHTAGEDKSLLDPFRPERPEDVERLKRLQALSTTTSSSRCKQRRGDRLAGENLFTGDIWVGQGGVDVGLADEVGHLAPTMRALYGHDVRFRADRARGGRCSAGSGCPGVAEALGGVEDRAHWSRFGLQAP